MKGRIIRLDDLQGQRFVFSGEVQLSDPSKPNEFWYLSLPVGTFYDSRYGWLTVNKELCDQLAQNFGKFPSYRLPVKEGHGDGARRLGEVKEVRADEKGFWTRQEMTDAGAKGLSEGAWLYGSSEFVSHYADKQTSKDVGAVFLGLALVNQPGHPGVAPIALAEGTGTPDQEKIPGIIEFADSLEGRKKDMPKTLEQLEKELEKERKALADAQERAKALEKEKEGLVKLSEEQKEALAKVEAEKKKVELSEFKKEWTQKGIPPAVMDTVCQMISTFGESEAVVQLSDEKGKEKEHSFKEAMEKVLSDMPKVKLGPSGEVLDSPDKGKGTKVLVDAITDGRIDEGGEK